MTSRIIIIGISLGCCVFLLYCFYQPSISAAISHCGNDTLEEIRKYHLVSVPVVPSSKLVNTDPSGGQRKIVSRILKNETNGYFVDCGAHDGLYLSNTLWLEQEYGWTGLLIEPDPGSFVKLAATGRNTWKTDLCLSRKPCPQTMSKVECAPLWDILQAVNVTQVDYLSLDTGRLNLEILRTIPFDRVLIKVLSVEYGSVPEGFDGVQKFLSSVGYLFIEDIIEEKDAIFAHPSVIFS